MGAGDPQQQRQCKSVLFKASETICDEPVAGRPHGTRHPAQRNATQTLGDGVTAGSVDMVRMIDGRLGEPFDDIGRRHQGLAALIGVADQVDDDIAMPAQQADVGFASRHHGEEMAIIARTREQEFRRRIGGTWRLDQQRGEWCGLSRRRPGDERPQCAGAAKAQRGPRSRALREQHIAEFGMGLGVVRAQRDRHFKKWNRELRKTGLGQQ